MSMRRMPRMVRPYFEPVSTANSEPLRCFLTIQPRWTSWCLLLLAPGSAFGRWFFGWWFLGDESSDVFRRRLPLMCGFLGDLRVAHSVFSVSSWLPLPGFPRCWVTPLVYVLGSEHTGTCAGGHQLDVIQMLLKRGAKLSYQAPWQRLDSFRSDQQSHLGYQTTHMLSK